MDSQSSSDQDSPIWSIPKRKERQERIRRLSDPDPHARLIKAVGDLSEGGNIGGRFQIKERIGEGGMSVVYRAWDHHRETMVALKCISPSLLQDPVAIKKFVQEAKIASRLAHPGIVKVFDVHQDQGVHFLEMELLEGENLRDWTKRQREKDVRPSLQTVNKVLQSICSALSYAHATTAHRDIKPENIALLPTGETKLMDFGLAQVLRPPHSSLFRESVNQLSAGTPYYMAPELLTPNGTTDARVDQYSLAVIAYELLTGDLPLGVSASLFEKRPDLPLRFTETVDRALNHRPDQRFPNIDDFATALARGARSEGLIDAARRRWRTASSVSRACMATLLGIGLFVPSTLWVRNHLSERASHMQAWHERTRVARTAMDQLREKAVALEMESSVLRRKMEVEGLVFARQAIVSPSLIQVSNKWHAVQQAHQWLQPRLNTEGDWALLSDLLSKAQHAIAEEIYHDAGMLLDQFDQELAIALDRSDKIKEIQQLYGSIQRLSQSISSIEEPASDETPDHAPLLTFMEQPDWNTGFNALKRQESEMRQLIRQNHEQAMSAFETSEERWISSFPPDLGPPDLNFLIDIPAMKDRALNLFQAERYSEAMDLMEEAAQTYDRWTDEVLAARERARPAWERSSKRIEAMGMRFVLVTGVYWSVWELRWMDFARWLADNREIEHLIMSQIDIDPKRIGPTHPVTGLDRRTAKSLAVWFGYNMDHFARPVSTLPTRQHWEELWITEDLKEDYQFGLAPEENPDRVLIMRDYYLDKGIQPEFHLKPVGMGVASPHGLFDLQGNAWEWSASDLVLKREESHNQETLKRMLHGGGYFGQHRYSSFEPPRDNAVFITRPEAIGMRIILQRNPTLDKAAQ